MNTRISRIICFSRPGGFMPLRHLINMRDEAHFNNKLPRETHKARDITLAIDALDGVPSRHRKINSRTGKLGTVIDFYYEDLEFLIDNHPLIAGEIFDELMRMKQFGKYYASTGTGQGPLDTIDLDGDTELVFEWIKEHPLENITKIRSGVKMNKQKVMSILDELTTVGRITQVVTSPRRVVYQLAQF